MLRHLFSLLLVLCLLLTANAASADDYFLQRHDTQQFIQRMVKKHGFDRSYLVSLFSAVKVRKTVMQHMNKPLEKESWRTYQLLFVNEWRIEKGVHFWNKYESALRKAEQIYGVPASIIVATIGIETKYGQRIGGYRVMDSLSNIAFSDSPRAAFFRSELEQFLLLCREQQHDPLKMMGSYAGAIGQPQFMPSSYRYYAVNFSNSGQTDLMHNEIDVIGSIANYYKKHGWHTNQPVAVPATILGERYNYFLRNNEQMKKHMSLAELSHYGVMPKHQMVQDGQKFKVIELQSQYNREYWLGYHNFDVIRRYNPSDLYAMAVYQLSYYITTLRDRQNNG